MKHRGIFEKEPGSKVWWICYYDQFGRKHREKAGTTSAAIKLYGKRKQQALEGKKLPEMLRQPLITFEQIANDALAYSKRNKRSYRTDKPRFARLKKWFGSCAADEITPKEIENRLARVALDEKWAASTFNHYRSLMSLTYRLAILNRKAATNPARSVPHRTGTQQPRSIPHCRGGKALAQGSRNHLAASSAGARSGNQYRFAKGKPIRPDLGHGRLEIAAVEHSAHEER